MKARAPGRVSGIGALIGAVLHLAGCADGRNSQVERGVAAASRPFSEVFVQRDSLDLEEADSVITVYPRVTITESHIWVADERDGQVRQYSREGELRLAFGRKGPGPGELNAPAKVLPVSDDLLLLIERFRWPNLAIWSVRGEPAFLGNADQPPLHLFGTARLLPDQRVVLASSLTTVVEPQHVHLGVFVGAIDLENHAGNGLTPNGGGFAADFEAVEIATAVPSNLVPAYTTAGWAVLDTRDNTIVVASSLQDTVWLHDLSGGTTLAVPFGSSNFRPVSPPPAEAATNPRVYQEWAESFSQIADLFLLPGNLVVVQFVDVVHSSPEFSLIGLTETGAIAFQVRNVPRILAWDDQTNRFLGYRSITGYPNELAWYAIAWPEESI